MPPAPHTVVTDYLGADTPITRSHRQLPTGKPSLFRYEKPGICQKGWVQNRYLASNSGVKLHVVP